VEEEGVVVQMLERVNALGVVVVLVHIPDRYSPLRRLEFQKPLP
jgi:hypothetical protein